jgi:ATP-binding cassette subfamily B (MDR/TAP) protein 1
MLACLPFLAGVGRIAGRLTATMSAKSSEAYAASSALAEQTLGNIRTVAAYHQEDKALEDYRQSLQIPLMVSCSSSSSSSL